MMFHVKHDMTTLNAEVVRDRLEEVGVTASDDQAALLVRHANLVLEHNERVNLTRITSDPDVLDLHIADSLAFLAHTDAPSGRWVDIGSGAGYPGIPLSIMGFDIVLCESVKKKAAFLADAVDALGLRVEVLPLRSEELAQSSPAAFDVVVARAVSSLPALVELASPLLLPEGCLIAMKGRPEASEREQAHRACSIVGMIPTKETEYALPNGESRSVFVYVRRGRPQVSLPRRPGMAQRQPFGVKAT